MGLYLRKSLRAGPVRFNLSGSGLGVSIGIPGLRVGVGPRGQYLHMGRGGVYYRRSLASHPDLRGARRSRAAGGPAAAAIAPPAAPAGPVPNLLGDPSEPSAVSAELNAAFAYRRRLGPSILLLMLVGWPLALAAGATPGWGGGPAVRVGLAIGLVLVLALGFLPRIARKDRVRSHAVLHFDESAPETALLGTLAAAMERLHAAGGLWEVRSVPAPARAPIGGAASGLPARAAANLLLPCLALSFGELFFLPDQALVFTRGAKLPFTSVPYGRLQVGTGRVRYREDGLVPPDATVVGHVFRHPTKDGHADRRFTDNPELPVVEYGQLTLADAPSEPIVLQCSNAAAVEAVAAALVALGARPAAGGAPVPAGPA